MNISNWTAKLWYLGTKESTNFEFGSPWPKSVSICFVCFFRRIFFFHGVAATFLIVHVSDKCWNFAMQLLATFNSNARHVLWSTDGTTQNTFHCVVFQWFCWITLENVDGSNKWPMCSKRKCHCSISSIAHVGMFVRFACCGSFSTWPRRRKFPRCKSGFDTDAVGCTRTKIIKSCRPMLQIPSGTVTINIHRREQCLSSVLNWFHEIAISSIHWQSLIGNKIWPSRNIVPCGRQVQKSYGRGVLLGAATYFQMVSRSTNKALLDLLASCEKFRGFTWRGTWMGHTGVFHWYPNHVCCNSKLQFWMHVDDCGVPRS